MTMIRAEQVQSRGNGGIRALSDPRPWATGAPALRPVSGQRINCLGDLDWPRWEGPEQGSRNCVGGAAERHYADRKVGIARGSRLPHPFLLLKGRENLWGSGRTGAWSQ